MSDTVLVERRDGVALVTLNRPEQLNAMNVALCDAFGSTVDTLAADSSVRAVVITGAGRAFCAGADFTALGDLAQQTGGEGPTAVLEGIRSLYDAFRVVERLPVPVVAAINGAAVGGGLGLSLLCDVRIVANDAKIGANFARLGIHAGMGITAMLPKAIGDQAAADMLFSGAMARGEELARLGFALEALPTAEVVPRAMEIATGYAAGAPLAVRAMKRTLRLVTRPALDTVCEIESYAQTLLGQTDDAREGVAAAMGRRDPEFKGR